MPFAYSVIKERNVSNVSTDRILKLIPGPEGAMSTDRRYKSAAAHMFLGNKRLHAVQNSGLWHLEFRQEDGKSAGGLPEILKQQWTSFNQLMKTLVPYFK